MIITNNGPQSIGQIQRFFMLGDLYLSPEEYQRMGVWNLEQKCLLIDTIFRRMDIPKLYFWKIDESTLANGYPDGDTKNLYKKLLDRKRRENNDLDPYIFEVVDGQQRIRSVLEYMGVKPPNNEVYRGIWHETFATIDGTPIAGGKYYHQLNAQQQILFDATNLTVMVLEKATIDEIRDMFLRLQNGTPLNAQQKRDAIGSFAGKVARELAVLPFFTNAINFDNNSAAHHLAASQMLYLEAKGKLVSCTSRQLDKFYEGHRRTPIDSHIASKAKNVLTILGRIFTAKNHYLNRSYAVGLYWTISQIMGAYAIADTDYHKIRENFEDLEYARLLAMNRDYKEPDDEIYFELSQSMSYGTDGAEGISTRHNILSQYLFTGVQLNPHLKLDPNRDFTYEEKCILYRRADGQCQMSYNGSICDKKIDFDDAVVDHILPHSKGGKTILENGRIAYKFCNIARGNREDFDPCTMCNLLPPSEASAQTATAEDMSGSEG